MLRRLQGWLRTLLRHAAVERETHEEMRFHLDRATERLMARGLSADEARAAAKREFGNLTYLEDEARDARGARWLENALQDARHAARGLRRTPGVGVAVIVTIGLGVGANTTLFSVVDRLFFRPPAYLAAPERSHQVYFTRIVRGQESIGQAYPYQRYLDLAASAGTMEIVAAYSPRRLAVGSGDAAREMLVGAASASYWRLFDARASIGRFFTAEEDREPDGARVAVLSYEYWQSRYGGTQSVLGESIVITPARYTIIGVTPLGFAGVARETPSIFIPIGMSAVDEFGPEWAEDRASYGHTWLEIYARQRSGIGREAATADLTAAFLDSYRKQLELLPAVTPPIDVARPRMFLGPVLADRGPRPSAVSRIAAWLFGVTIIVLLIACANVGNLLLARAWSRRREIAIRLALGVSRARLLRYLLLESITLALLGGLAGLALAHWGGSLLRTFLISNVEWPSVLADKRTLLFAALTTAVVGLAAGLPPMVQAARYSLVEALRTGAREGSGRPSRVRRLLVLAQVTLSVLLLIGAGLFVRSVDRIADLRLGYDADRLLLVDLRLRTTVLDSAGQVHLRRALLERAERNPVVESATLACSAPFSGTCAQRVFVAGLDSTAHLGEFVRQIGSPSYFQTTGTRILRGRGLLPEDREGTPFVAVVSEAMANVLWPGDDAIGRCFRTGSPTAPCRTVVGIAENVKQERIGHDAGLQYYVPARQDVEYRGRLLVRVHGDPAVQAEALRRDLAGEMPTGTYLVVRPMAERVANVTRSWRLGAVMFSGFGALALIVAGIGVYSVIAYDVAQRRREIGVRIALGARAADVLRLVVADGVRVVIAGTAIGMLVALGAGRWVGPLLFDVSPRDPLVFGIVGVVLIAVAVAASGWPAMRATRADPATVLRTD